LYIGDCRVHDNAGDPTYFENHSGSGILVGGADGAVIERSVASRNGALCNASVGGPVGIWAFASTNVVIQHCESHHNRTGSASFDGGGFDLDGAVSSSVMQYNYSHDNDGPGFMVYSYSRAPGPSRNNVVRFNISENDGRHKSSAGIFLGKDGGDVDGVDV